MKMIVQTKRIENPIYVITHIYSTGSEIYGENVVGVYNSKIEASISIQNLVEEVAQKMKKEVGYDITRIESDSETFTAMGRFQENTFMEKHHFKISTFDKNYLYVCNCVGL